jgi:hypothetical protein
VVQLRWMEEWTDRLRHRREEIIARLEAMGTPKVGTRGFQEQPHLNQELVTIEQTLAQVESTKALHRKWSRICRRDNGHPAIVAA